MSDNLIQKVQKRNGSTVPFDSERIANAIYKAMEATESGEKKDAEAVAKKVVAKLNKVAKKEDKDFVPSVETIQDMVEEELILGEYAKAAKAFILYRQKRAEIRLQKKETPVPENVKQLANESKKFFPNLLSEFVYYTTYSKWIPEEKRRETWVETIDRYISFMKEKIKDSLSEKEYEEIRDYMLNMSAMGSMRLLWAAGTAARATNVAAYNCSFIAPTKWQDFGEIAYVLMCGTGVGFSVEEHTVAQLPLIEYQSGEKLETFVIPDSKEGWSDAIVHGLKTWSEGKDIKFDYSQIRPQGARLKTMGGRASGPEPLKSLLDFSREKILARQGRRLSTIDVHDIICKIGEVVVMGGVRRSALISLSDLDDVFMREAKNGQFYLTHPERMMANNSTIYNDKPSTGKFLEEWINLIKGQSGERGIFNAAGFEKQLPKRRLKYLKKIHGDDLSKALIRVNPCGEIYLQSRQFCNLTSIVIRAGDTKETLEKKMEIATLLGTYQSTLTNFNYLSKEWKKNCEAERLLGVSLTGYYDNKIVRDTDILKNLKDIGIKINKKYAERFKIKQSTCITCVKPHGNSSQLLDTASGMHPRYAKYYIRRVRVSAADPVFQMLKDQGVPYHPEVGQREESATTFVLDFPVESPKGAIVREDIGAKEMLDEWKKLKINFTEHNPSVTIYIGEDEWISVANFLYENWDYVGGLSFLPHTDHIYKLAPYEEISKEKYEELVARVKDVDFSKLITYEKGDTTNGSKELACVAGICEI